MDLIAWSLTPYYKLERLSTVIVCGCICHVLLAVFFKFIKEWRKSNLTPSSNCHKSSNAHTKSKTKQIEINTLTLNPATANGDENEKGISLVPRFVIHLLHHRTNEPIPELPL